MVAAIAFVTATAALLSGVENLQAATDRGAPRTRRLGGPCPGRHQSRGRLATSLRGRVDSAKAEELLAGLGFNVDEASTSPASTKRRSGRRRQRAEDTRNTDSCNNNNNNNNNGVRDADTAAPGTTTAGLTPDKKVSGQAETHDVEGLKFLGAADFIVPAEDRLAFERNGHAVTRGLFSAQQLTNMRPSIVEAFELQEMNALRQKVSVWFGDETATELETAAQLRARLKRLAPEEIPFLQVFNMFRKNGPRRETIERIVKSPRLAYVAAQLLGCERVRLYQDSTFCKRPGDGPTRWHSDLNMAPLDCNDFVTAWVPLEAVPARKDGGSPLVFASKSHRDFALNHWQDSRLRGDLTGRYRERDHAPLSAGDVTWHHGWTLHSSPGNTRDRARVALAISYFRDGTRLLSDSTGRSPDPEDKWSYADWAGDLPAGGVVEHASVPLVWDGVRSLRRPG